MEKTMRLWTKMAAVLMFVPLFAFAQFRDLDTALSNLNRGFGNGDVQAIVAGIEEGGKVRLQFPGLASQDGFFGRDQASLLLDGLFNKVQPGGFEPVNVGKASAEGQYHITARWDITVGGKQETRDLYITLKSVGDRWVVASVQSASR
jgi:hypothetical protein